MKSRLYQYKYLLLLLYFPVYMAVFYLLEKNVPNKIHIIDCALDAYIPFVEYFIIPYLLWFVYIGAAGLYFMFFDKESFCKLMYFGMIGMTLFLVVSYLYPNGLELRPDSFARDNIFVELTKYVYSIDTPTNVLPSIHVYNSIGVSAAVQHSEKLRSKVWVQRGARVAAALIVLSTMFVKQHSVIDVLTGMALACAANEIIYSRRPFEFHALADALRYRRKTIPEWFGK